MRLTLYYDQAFWNEVMEVTGARTKSEAVEIALRRFVEAKKLEAEWAARWDDPPAPPDTT